MKGLILAGGSGTRLYPVTYAITKQLLPVYDKPLIYYSLSLLMLAGIKDIAIISTPEDIPLFKKVLKDGSQWGVKLSYFIQNEPKGIAQAFTIAESFIDEPICFVLGDNIFYGHGLPDLIKKAALNNKGGTVFGYIVNNPSEYGVAVFDNQQTLINIEEKPTHPKSKYAITGLYIYNPDVVNIAKSIQPSARGELEITDVNNVYIQQQKLNFEIIGRGTAWLDTGTHDTLLEAGRFVQVIEKRQGLKIACLEEIAFRNRWIDANHLEKLSEPLQKNQYGQYLSSLLKELP